MMQLTFRYALLTILLWGWTVPFLLGVYYKIAESTYDPVDDFDNWTAVGYHLLSMSLTGLAALWFAIAGVAWLIWSKSRSPLPYDACFKCGYNLTGNESGVCPECGMPVEPKPTEMT